MSFFYLRIIRRADYRAEITVMQLHITIKMVADASTLMVKREMQPPFWQSCEGKLLYLLHVLAQNGAVCDLILNNLEMFLVTVKVDYNYISFVVFVRLVKVVSPPLQIWLLWYPVLDKLGLPCWTEVGVIVE